MKKILVNIWFVWKMIISVLYALLFITRGFSWSGSTMACIVLVLNGLLFLSTVWGAFLLLRHDKKGLAYMAGSTLVNIVVAALAIFVIPNYFAYYIYCVVDAGGGLLMSGCPYIFSFIGLFISWGAWALSRAE